MKKTKTGILLTNKEALIFRDILGGLGVAQAEAILRQSCNYSKVTPEKLYNFAYEKEGVLRNLLGDVLYHNL